MRTEFETADPMDLPRSFPRKDDPDKKWIAWALYTAGSLILALAAVMVLGLDQVLLLGWAVGVIVAAVLTVFGGH